MQVEISLQIHPDFQPTPAPHEPLMSLQHEELNLPPERTWQAWFQHWTDLLKLTDSPIGFYELALVLTTDEAIQTLNNEYRQVNQPTDVLSFSALEVDSPQSPELLAALPLYLGDIVISVHTAHRQAKRQGHSLEWELAWLGSHGFLHLLGWGHPDEAHLQKMLYQQATLLESVGFQLSPDFRETWGLGRD